MKINVYTLDAMSDGDKARLLRRAEDDIDSLRGVVQPIIDDVRSRGDDALVHYAKELDRAELSAGGLRVAADEFRRADDRLDPAVKDAIVRSVENIRKFHRAQMPGEAWMIEVLPGVTAGEKVTPITSVGLYVPRGKGSFPSVMMMLSVPAVIAGVEKVVVCTPPTAEGTVDDASLFAARVCGIGEVYKVGGAQAIAALAFGTATIPKVDKVLGPGNKYVSAAKRLLYGRIDVGTPAGPSESIILCDEQADPRLVARDLLIEAEHGPDSSALLVTHSAEIVRAVLESLPALTAELPDERRRYCEAVLAGFGGIVVTTGLDASIAFVNAFAPEHLEVLTTAPYEVLPRIKNAGEILLGPHTPITLGNFSLGVNAILPTGGFARTFSCVGVHDFLKRSSFACVSKDGFAALAGPARVLAEFEGFPSHARAITFRERG